MNYRVKTKLAPVRYGVYVPARSVHRLCRIFGDATFGKQAVYSVPRGYF